MLHTKIRDFLHPRAGVIERQQEGMIAEHLPTLARQLHEERRNLCPIQEAHLRQGKDRVVRRPAIPTPVVIGKLPSDIQELARERWIEEERQATRSFGPRARLHR
jgi:hypothetical protein